MTSSGPRRKRLHRSPYAAEVDGLNFVLLQSTIQWTGKVRLHKINEDCDAFLSECQWPKRSGHLYYACASTGLLFDKQSGECRQSNTVSLLIDTVAPTVCSYRAFTKWLKEKMDGWGGSQFKNKRGPKPKGSRPTEDEGWLEDVDAN